MYLQVSILHLENGPPAQQAARCAAPARGQAPTNSDDAGSSVQLTAIMWCSGRLRKSKKMRRESREKNRKRKAGAEEARRKPAPNWRRRKPMDHSRMYSSPAVFRIVDHHLIGGAGVNRTARCRWPRGAEPCFPAGARALRLPPRATQTGSRHAHTRRGASGPLQERGCGG